MAYECASLRLELLSQRSEIRSQRELILQWFETLFVEFQDVKKQNSELLAKFNSFTNTEQPEATILEPLVLKRFPPSVYVDTNHDIDRELLDEKSSSDNLGLFPESFEMAHSPEGAVAAVEPGFQITSNVPKTPESQTNPEPVIEVLSSEINLCDLSCASGDQPDSVSSRVTEPKVLKTRRNRRSTPMPRAESTSLERRSHKSKDKPSKKEKQSNLRCSKCSYEASHSFLLKKHSLTHTRGKPFSCDVCDYRCETKSGLLRHKYIHSQKKAFQCYVCNRSFTAKNSLEKHNLSHTKEKPFKCEICKISFTRKRSVVRHGLIHSGEKPFSCDVCDYRCRSTGHLLRHSLTHTGEKAFKCDQCSHRTSRKDTLIVHRRTHSGEKPFQCDMCDYRAARKFYLVSHKKRIHRK